MIDFSTLCAKRSVSLGSGPSFADLLSSFNSLMTMPSFQSFIVIATGWILTPERRTVTQIIQSAGAVGTKDHSAFHRFLNSARWSREDVSLEPLP